MLYGHVEFVYGRFGQGAITYHTEAEALMDLFLNAGNIEDPIYYPNNPTLSFSLLKDIFNAWQVI